jgi:hypothetical protein
MQQCRISVVLPEALAQQSFNSNPAQATIGVLYLGLKLPFTNEEKSVIQP